MFNLKICRLSNEKRVPSCLRQIGITQLNGDDDKPHYTDPYEATSTMESKGPRVFSWLTYWICCCSTDSTPHLGESSSHLKTPKKSLSIGFT